YSGQILLAFSKGYSISPEIILNYATKVDFCLADDFNFYRSIFNDDFKNFLREVFSSKCVKKYYEDCETDEEYNLSESEIFDKFISLVNFVPMGLYKAGASNSSLLVFVDNHECEIDANEENLIKAVII